MERESKVFMCYVSGSGKTSRIHNTRESADTEAKRLADLARNKGKKVYVLADVAKYQVEMEEHNAER